MQGRGGGGGGGQGRRVRPMMTAGGAPRHPRGGSGGRHGSSSSSSSSSFVVDGRQHQYRGRPRDHGHFNNKRGRDHHTTRHGGDHGEYEGEVVDDLLVAAQYANMSLSGKRDEEEEVGSTTKAACPEASSDAIGNRVVGEGVFDDENEIDTDDVIDLDIDEYGDSVNRLHLNSSQQVGDANGDTSTATGDSEAKGTTAANSASHPIDTNQNCGEDDDSARVDADDEEGSAGGGSDDDDDESTVDLEAELARMTDAGLDDDEDEGHNDRSRTAGPPRTAHEVVDEEEVDPRALAADPINSSPSSASPDRNDDPTLGRLMPIHFEGHDWQKRFQRCGVVQRKVVGETSAASNSATTATTSTTLIVQADPSHLLEEGNVLWILIESSDLDDDGRDVSKSSNTGTNAYMAMVGTVTEVFGPVRQPCYKVRVLIPVERNASATAAKALTPSERPTAADSATTNETTVEPSIDPAREKPAAAPTDSTNDNAAQYSPPAPSWKVSPQVLDKWSDRQVEVYYRVGMVTTLDAHQVWRQSGRGCDASNLWDEEVVDANAMEYSDDEQEQLAKQRHKHSRKDPQQTSNRPRDGGSGHVSSSGNARASYPSLPVGTRHDRTTVDRTSVYPKPNDGAHHHFPSSHGTSSHVSSAYATSPAAVSVQYPSYPPPETGPRGFHSNASSQPPIGPNRYHAPHHGFPPVGPMPASGATGFGPTTPYNNSGGGASVPPHSSTYPAPSYYYPMTAGSNLPMHSPPPPPPPPAPAAAPAEESDTIYYDYS